MNPVTQNPASIELKRWLRIYLSLGDRSALGGFAPAAGEIQTHPGVVFIKSTALAITFNGQRTTMPASVAIAGEIRQGYRPAIFSRS